MKIDTGNKDVDRFVRRMQLRSFLGKLGLKSVLHKDIGLTEEDISAATTIALSNYGRPDQIMMSEEAHRAYMRAFKK